jgi:DNA repair protein RecN (Recombination protein N)
MLTHLQLRDFVLVEQAELEFSAGLTALTGETGAGKSIVVDALLLIAGGRGGGDIVRAGAERAEVTAAFGELPRLALDWLEAQTIDYGGELLVRRVIGADGRSRAYVNGQIVPLQALRDLAEHLLEVHGQQEFQRLVSRAAQRELLDERLPDSRLRSAVADAYARHKECRLMVESLEAAAANRDARLELLRYQLLELQAEVTSTAEIETLLADQKRAASRNRLGSAAAAALSAAFESDEGSAHDLLGRATAALRTVSDLDPRLAQAGALLGEAAILTQESAAALRHYLDDLDIDPKRLEEIERRAAALEALARKHRIAVLELPLHRDRVAEELAGLEQAGISLAALTTQREALAGDFRDAAQRLTAARKVIAAQFSRQVTELMQVLGMAGGEFAVTVSASDAEFAPEGSDEVEFLVSANPGQSLKSLAKVASGGELSRISLAVQVAGRSGVSSRCMVFDEVDAGIGGAVAEIVGRQLRELGERGQVLCVTHLPQVASQAHGQFRVTKLTDGKITRTAVKPLGTLERVDEIARMLGGIDITEQARAHARDMLRRAAGPESVSAEAAGIDKKKRARGAPR